MARTLVLVSRQHPDLYAFLQTRFSNAPTVAVVLDRRLGQRRQLVSPVRRDRRLADRRSRPDVDAELRERSHVIVAVT
jgi:hypothetical protein